MATKLTIGATTLFEKGVSEKIIQEHTGHRSLEALRIYEHTNTAQHQAVSNISAGAMQPHPVSSYPTLNAQPDISRSSHISTSSVHSQSLIPEFQFGDLHGCTINIHPSAVQSNTTTSSSYSSCPQEQERDIDELFRQLVHKEF